MMIESVNAKRTVLLIDDELEIWEPVLKAGLGRHRFDVVAKTDPDQALDYIERLSPAAILLDIRFPGEGRIKVDKGKATLEKIKRAHPTLPVIMITTTLEEDKYEVDEKDYPGAYHVFSKTRFKESGGAGFKALADILEEAIREAPNATQPLDEKLGFVVGKTQRMCEVADLILRVAAKDSTVLILGETGTGKEPTAQAIHKNSPRSGRNMKSINMAALPPSDAGLAQLDALVGHAANQPPWRDRGRAGVFEDASGGTVFLDEIGDAKAEAQEAILRVIQEREVQRIGSNTVIKVDIRLIAATNQDLEKRIREGRFREDLYHRLRVVTIELPPLRERLDDLGELWKHFVCELNKKYQKAKSDHLRDQVLEILQRYPWPGNIRELEHVIEQAIVRSKADVLTASLFKELRPRVNPSAPMTGVDSAPGKRSTDFAAAKAKLAEVQKVMIECGWKKGNASEKLGFLYHQGITRTVEQVWRDFPELKKEFPRLAESFQKRKPGATKADSK